MDHDVEQRLKEFKFDLKVKNTSYIVRRYTTFGRPYIISDTRYFELKANIADRFEIHPSEIIMVGSGKLGFSIKPKKRFTPFGEDSDIDIAIVSPTLFDKIWREVLEYSETENLWYYEKKRDFQEYLFRGWVRPDKLPPSRLFQMARDWWEFFNNLTREQGTFKINGGLYKTWYHFELYQSRAVDSCKQNMELEAHGHSSDENDSNK